MQGTTALTWLYCQKQEKMNERQTETKKENMMSGMTTHTWLHCQRPETNEWKTNVQRQLLKDTNNTSAIAAQMKGFEMLISYKAKKGRGVSKA